MPTKAHTHHTSQTITLTFQKGKKRLDLREFNKRRRRRDKMDDFDMGLLDDVAYMRTVLRQKLLGLHPVFMYKIKEQQPGQEYL